jgi:branched-chain amino acid aminotransferase
LTKELKLTVSKWKRPSPESAPTDSKAAGLYMICSLSKHEAEKDGFDDALMMDYRNYIAEATGANIFFVKGQEVIFSQT